MTRKDYIKAAELVKVEFGAELSETVAKERVIFLFCQFFRNDNPRFDSDRFRQACNEKK